MSLFVTLYIFFTFNSCVLVPLLERGGWVGAVCAFWYEYLLVVSACESLHVCTVCIRRREHARFCVEVFMRYIKKKKSFIHYWCNRCVYRTEQEEKQNDVYSLVFSPLPP